MTQPNFVAYDAFVCEYEWFETFEQAAAWLSEENSEEISEETIGELSFIARITHRTKFVETDNRKNYHEHTEECTEVCDEEEWPYSDEYDSVGKIVFVPVEDGATTRLTNEEIIKIAKKLLPPATAIAELFTIEANCGGVAIETKQWLEFVNEVRSILEDGQR